MSRLSSGALADRSSSGGLVPVAALLAAGAMGFVLLSTQTPLGVVTGALLAYAAGWGWNGLFHFAIVHHYPDAPGTASGLSQTGLSAGVAAGPVIFGLLAEWVGYRWAWSTAAGAMGLGGLMVAAGARMLARRAAAAQPADS
jgi:predicted MFS family arabinose efflux permease